MPHILTPKAGVANNSQMLVTKTNNSTGQRWYHRGIRGKV